MVNLNYVNLVYVKLLSRMNYENGNFNFQNFNWKYPILNCFIFYIEYFHLLLIKIKQFWKIQ